MFCVFLCTFCAALGQFEDDLDILGPLRPGVTQVPTRMAAVIPNEEAKVARERQGRKVKMDT